MRDDTRDYLSLFLNDTPLLDVRAPVEFAKGAFPGAANIALINDDERHQIGICYKQQGQQAAIDLGNKLVSGEEREQRMRAWQQWWQANPNGTCIASVAGCAAKPPRPGYAKQASMHH